MSSHDIERVKEMDPKVPQKLSLGARVCFSSVTRPDEKLATKPAIKPAKEDNEENYPPAVSSHFLEIYKVLWFSANLIRWPSPRYLLQDWT